MRKEQPGKDMLYHWKRYVMRRFASSTCQLDVCWTTLENTSISELPSGISALVQLQYFDLYNTHIKALPSELGELVNLRFLLLSHMPLERIPNGVMCRLTLLQVLYMDLSYGKAGTCENGVDLKELESLRRLKAFDATIQTVAPLQKLAQSPVHP
jgi:disease resistance protein RPS2